MLFRTLIVVTLACVSFATSGCTTTHVWSAADAASIPAKTQIGDEAKIRLRDGSELAFVVSEITQDSVSGAGLTVNYADIESMRVERDNPGATTLLVIGMVGAVAITLDVIDTTEDLVEAFAPSSSD